MPTEFPPPISELLETFEELEDWEERYEFILDIGRDLPAMNLDLKVEENKVHGCMSTVWLALKSHLDSASDSTKIAISADSDSMIVKGLIVLLLSLYNGKTPAAAIAEDPQAFFSSLGLNQHLSPNRRNGLFSMVGRIRELCVKIEATA
ncbi:MAG: SufE family protein [Pirellulaceae bacterium]|nr:SufE family protein [Pirellulaceae bacterium]